MYLSNSLYILPYRVSAHLRLMEDGMALKAAGLAIFSGDSGAVFSGIHTVESPLSWGILSTAREVFGGSKF